MDRHDGVTYDDASWHTGSDFPEELDTHAARTHIGMFLAWAIERGLGSELVHESQSGLADGLRAGTLTGAEVLRDACDDTLSDDCFSETGRAFAGDYYEEHYLDDYVALSDDRLPTIYHEPNSQEKYARLRAVLDRRFSEWQRGELGAA